MDAVWRPKLMRRCYTSRNVVPAKAGTHGIYMEDQCFLADIDSRLRENDAAECRRYCLTQREQARGGKRYAWIATAAGGHLATAARQEERHRRRRTRK